MRSIDVASLTLVFLAACAASAPQKPTATAAAAPNAAELAPPAPAAAAATPPRAAAMVSVDATAGAVDLESALGGEVALLDEGSDGTDELHQQATEHCEEASALLGKGDVDGAMEHVDAAYAMILVRPSDSDEEAEAKQNIRQLVAKLIAKAYNQGPAAAHKSPASWDLGLPMVNNIHVQREIQLMTTVEKRMIIDSYRRAGRFRPMMLEKLKKAGLPSQLSWLPLVESAFKTHALSSASAFGLWQFIASTGLRYGLKRDQWIDERLDPEKATDAAIAYLGDLHGMFGDWAKALAAYNCGEGRVRRVQERNKEQYMDFWDIYLNLPLETRRYFPRLVAALHILENPEKYGIELPEPDAPFTDVAIVTIERPVKLELLDRALGLPVGTLFAYNPELRQKATPNVAYDLRVPMQQSELVLAQIATVPKWEPPKIEYVVHRVRSGETLSHIAERYRTSVRAIMQYNHIRSASRIWPGQRLRIPART